MSGLKYSLKPMTKAVFFYLWFSCHIFVSQNLPPSMTDLNTTIKNMDIKKKLRDLCPLPPKLLSFYFMTVEGWQICSL